MKTLLKLFLSTALTFPALAFAAEFEEDPKDTTPREIVYGPPEIFGETLVNSASGGIYIFVHKILPSAEGVYIGKADVDYSFYDFYKPRTPLKINVAHSDDADQLLVHISDGENALCSVFGGIKFKSSDSPIQHDLKYYQYPVVIESIGAKEHYGVIQDAVMVTDISFHHKDNEKPIYIAIGADIDDQEYILPIDKIKNSPEQSFDALRKSCYAMAHSDDYIQGL